MRAAFVVVIAFLSAAFAYGKPAPGLSATASVIPGLGQTLNGEPVRGLFYLSAVVGGAFAGGPYFPYIAQNIWFYNIYEAYQDAGAKRTQPHSIAKNWLATLNPTLIVDPIGAPIVGTGIVAGARGGYPVFTRPGEMVVFSFVGLGEEALFRGVLYPGFTDLTGSRVIGNLTSSVLFAAAHGVADTTQLRLLPMLARTFAGVAFAVQTERHDYDLRHSIFAHAWYDIFIVQDQLGIRAQIPF